MTDPMLSLAISMHANPGVYALLLGSGVSRSAGIPTGWEIVEDLIRKVATAANEDCDPDPAAWYAKKYGHSLTYGGLLNHVAKTPAERSRILRPYFEPTETDRAEGRKVPTPAHHAIARLIKAEYVRLIITTNFDRLLEQALDAAAITPTVIANADAAEGAFPITHNRCTIVKVHGDYTDTRIKNTPDELDSYEPPIDALLDRAFDEFGLIVCGWSAEWDGALRAAILRCKARRFSMYWTTRREPNEVASQLIEHRAGDIIKIDGADGFFTQLSEKADALHDIEQPHPLSAKLAIAQVKRYIVEPKARIRLSDLIMGEVEQVRTSILSDKYPIVGAISDDDFELRVASFERMASVITSMMAAGCFWAEDGTGGPWVAALGRLVNLPQPRSYREDLLAIRSYPAVLSLYAGGIGALAAKNYRTLLAIWTEPRIRLANRDVSLGGGFRLRIHHGAVKRGPDYGNKKTALSIRLASATREAVRELVREDDEYEQLFDTFEYLQALVAVQYGETPFDGRFTWRNREWDDEWIVPQVLAEAKQEGAAWGPLTLFRSVGEFEDAARTVSQIIKDTRWW